MRLETSSLERKRVGAVWKLEAIPSNRTSTRLTTQHQNLDYARTLLLQLEYQSVALKAPNQRQRLLADLADQRDQLTRLNERLYQFGQVCITSMGRLVPFNPLAGVALCLSLSHVHRTDTLEGLGG